MAKRGVNLTQSSFSGTVGGTTVGGPVSPVFALRYIIKNCPLLQFEISIYNADGTRRSDSQLNGEEPKPKKLKPGQKEKKVAKGPKSNAAQIQQLLDQRKPPTEKLPSLCAEYDDALGKINDMDL